MPNCFTKKKQGYGFTFKTGIRKATGDLIVLCEPDGSFKASEISKFLKAAEKECEVVFATRTKNIDYKDGLMNLVRAWANLLVGKSVQFLFRTPSEVSDIGTTYKLLKSSIAKQFVKESKTDNPLFATELLLLAVSQGKKFTEVPVTFRKRTGPSSFTQNWQSLVKWGLLVQLFIFSFWLSWLTSKVKDR